MSLLGSSHMNQLFINPKVSLNLDTNDLVFKELTSFKLVHLEPMPAKLLETIVRKNGKVATRQELIDQIWFGNEGVGGKALTKNIYKLRKIFQEHLREELIRTIPKGGYQLVSKVKITEQPVHTINRSRKWLNISIGAAIGILIILKIANPGFFHMIQHGLMH